MAQMVLPNTPAPGMQSDAGSSKVGSGRDSRDSGSGETRYQAVSRAEQKRLDRQQSGRSDEPRDTRQAGSDNPNKADATQASNQVDRNRKTGDPGEGGNPVSASEDSVAGTETAGETAAPLPDMEAVTTPVTFTELQALLLPANGQTATAVSNPGVSVNGQPINQAAGLFAGQPGQTSPGISGGLTAGLQMADGPVPLAGEKTLATDPARLLTGTRFESALEVAAQQSATATGKMLTEAQAPLRGYATSIDVPVNHAEWGDKLMGKLSWLTAKNLSMAEIHLTPPDMGPMEVRVRVQNDQANITVHTANPVVRDQLELHSHRLRDMLGEQGLALAQFDVSDNPGHQHGEQGGEQGEAAFAGSGARGTVLDNGGDEIQTGSLDLGWKGTVDIFA
ncbi:flagellar hook-length control protein FliK [Streptosporangium jomthongense]|uniref:Flagellar hook-length control protein FliK n=1 Tax=Marinobacter aromaticivorans TaxID=1494078 RepID=A0ABW2ISM2_9GAMM|nr:flagellar hook-length control protein FliK [Marinobacter aromaticivorans]GGE58417.1 flagellar hook-length control protein FliK [Streptosporangium jomthongense]